MRVKPGCQLCPKSFLNYGYEDGRIWFSGFLCLHLWTSFFFICSAVVYAIYWLSVVFHCWNCQNEQIYSLCEVGSNSSGSVLSSTLNGDNCEHVLMKKNVVFYEARSHLSNYSLVVVQWIQFLHYSYEMWCYNLQSHCGFSSMTLVNEMMTQRYFCNSLEVCPSSYPYSMESNLHS